MHINEPEASTPDGLALDEYEYFRVASDGRDRKFVEYGQDLGPIAQIPAGKLPDNERMREHILHFQLSEKSPIFRAKVIDPDRSVHQDHCRLDRRLGIDSSCGSVPPGGPIGAPLLVR